MVPLFAPVSIAATTHERKSDGIVICTTTGLKLLTRAGEIVPIGEHEDSVSSEHCEACFLSGFAENFDRDPAGLLTFYRVIESKTHPVLVRRASRSWTKSCLGARAPPAYVNF